jgi:hypothetical protein
LPARVGDAGALLFQFIYDHTWSAFGAPEWANIPLPEFCSYFSHKTPEAIRKVLKDLEKIHLIERHPDDPWRFKTHPENVGRVPVRERVKHPNAAASKRQARVAMLSAPADIAALSRTGVEHGSQCRIVESPELTMEDEQSRESYFNAAQNECRADPSVGHSDTASAGTDGGTPAPMFKLASAGDEERAGDRAGVPLKLVSITSKRESQREISVSDSHENCIRGPEDHCPHDWACPFLTSDLTGHKPLSQINLNTSKPDRPANADTVEPPTSIQTAEIRKLLLDEWSDLITADEPTQSLCIRIHTALQGAPLEWRTPDSHGIGLFRHRLRRRAASVQSYGFALSVAEGLGRAWQEHCVLRRRQEIDTHQREVDTWTARVIAGFHELSYSWMNLVALAPG